MRILFTVHKGFIGSRIYEILKYWRYKIDGVDLGDNAPDAKFDIIVILGLPSN
jgi:hypothetical protein